MPVRVGKPWGAHERELLRAWVAAKVPFAECGRRLGRTQRQAQNMARYFGFFHGVRPAAAERREAVARLHARGLSPWAMSKKLRCKPSAVYRDHGVLGLAPHRIDPRERGLRSRAATIRKTGKDAGQLRRERERVATFQDGWPPTSPAAARDLDVFYRLGPATVAGHHARLGRGHERSTQNRLRKLCGAGHLVEVGRVLSRTSWARVWDLAPAVRDRRRQVLAYRSASIEY